MRSPLNKEHRVTSSFGMRNLKGKPEMHNGVDLVPLDAVHPCELYAVCDGIVEDVCKIVSDSHTGLSVTAMVTGNFVNIRTKENYLLIYRHLKADSIPNNIIKGAQIQANQKIGLMGATGQSTGIHLHYEIRNPKSIPIDPAPFIGTSKTFADILESKDNITQSTVKVQKDSNNINGQALKVGDRVKVEPGAKDYNNGSLASFVYIKTYDVLQATDDRIVIGIKGTGITAAINAKHLKKV